MQKSPRKGRPRASEERVGPTPETALKSIPDPLAQFSSEHQQVGLVIAATHAAINGRGNVRAQVYETRSRGHGDPLDRISKSRLDAYWHWRKAVTSANILIGAVLDTICDMIPPHEVDRQRKLKPDTTAEWVIEALNLYRA